MRELGGWVSKSLSIVREQLDAGNLAAAWRVQSLPGISKQYDVKLLLIADTSVLSGLRGNGSPEGINVCVPGRQP